MTDSDRRLHYRQIADLAPLRRQQSGPTAADTADNDEEKEKAQDEDDGALYQC